MSGHARAFWVAAPGRGEIRRVDLPAMSGGEARVRALYSGISRGTEALVFNGLVPESEAERMRAPFQDGDFPAPVKYGYASVARIDEGPAAIVGRTAFCLYPHQTEYTVPVSALHLLPEDVPPARAVLAANLETALNGVWDARPHAGDRVTVIGGGTVGCLVAWLAGRMPGCRVELVDLDPRRARVAAALGVHFAEPEGASGDADLVIHASGQPAGLDLALRLAGLETTIVEMSWFGSRPAGLMLGGAFHSQRLTIVSSQVGRIPASQRARWDSRRRMALALRLLADPVLDTMITGESRFDDLPEVMARLAADPGETLCHRIRYVT